MAILIVILVIVAAALLFGLFTSVRILKEYEDGVFFWLGQVGGERAPGLHFNAPILFG